MKRMIGVNILNDYHTIHNHSRTIHYTDRGDVEMVGETFDQNGNQIYQKSTFHETKEVVSRLREPLKIKTVAITSTIPEKQGHMLECTANVSWGEIDEMETNMKAMIKVWIGIIESPTSEGGMGSKYLGLKKTDT